MSASSSGLVQLSRQKLFNDDEFRKADRMERIYVYLVSGGSVGPYRLREPEKRYLELLEKAYNLFHTHRSKRETVKMMRQFAPATSDASFSATQIVENAMQLFGRFEEIDRKTQRGMVRENILKRIGRLEAWIDSSKDKETGKFTIETRDIVAAEKVIQGYWKQLAELDQLNKPENGKDAPRPIPEIVFSDDPKVLTEDTEAEIVT